MLLVKQLNIIESFADADIKAVKSKYGLRRADRFTTLAATAIQLTFPEQFPSFLHPDTGLVTTSSLGPHKTVFAMLDDILDYPEDQILPTKFSHSVHNAAASYLGAILNINGPAFAISNFESPLFEALRLADTLLAANLCPQLLLLAIEENALLTQSLPTLYPERFPSEPKEAAAVFLLESSSQSAAVNLPPIDSQDGVFGLPLEHAKTLLKTPLPYTIALS
ncbi:MAG: beta-ketoacyl synthase chain length factor [Victivallales bacterium]|nr:beta-ketoacyl synthase chain length factor [Victivallales bacterium]